MNIEEKGRKLRAFAQSVHDDPRNREEIDSILPRLGLTLEDVIDTYVHYDLDIYAYKNGIYEKLAMRAVLHFHNLLEGSWHQERQHSILEMIRGRNPKSIVDMGFGVPTKYVRQHVLPNKIPTTFVDMYDSAFHFAGVLLDYLDPNWDEFIDFKKIDMNTHTYPGDFNCYIFQDSIEHVNDAHVYLRKVVENSPDFASFVLSLPIGPLVPMHTISWDTDQQAIDRLRGCNLEVQKSDKVYVNPDVDLFADQIKGNFYNLIVRCRKGCY